MSGATAFPNRGALDAWFVAHHAEADLLWVRLYRKQSGVASVTWDDCVRVALVWGWIDGLKQSESEISWLQRLTPRRKGSNWSPRNQAIAKELIATGQMRPPGLEMIRVAQESGRWSDAIGRVE
ncbi:YdeI/OmpD-associated family protein [Pelagovum pacificum]|uniref:Uncharacterized protein n=1 Tax=Pelagovum pacificum TaxID=2588711 RepID=A0A5C5GHF4_9RHOB|nr:hypothetical protein [Pelagovum pacificum]QQA43542.1 hypothetical protein I8N54_02895 [Pelagovum pacificum]TNY33321.1 hypothetical protein FHY64_08635 [Pelagovum pacificum]